MPTLSPIHLIIILVIALIVIGPGKLPEVGAALGKSIKEFRKAASDITDTAHVDAAPAPQAPAYAPPPPVYSASAAPAYTARKPSAAPVAAVAAAAPIVAAAAPMAARSGRRARGCAAAPARRGARLRDRRADGRGDARCIGRARGQPRVAGFAVRFLTGRRGTKGLSLLDGR